MVQYGITYRDSGDLRVQTAFKQANTINPEDEEVLETLALTYFSLGAIDKPLPFAKTASNSILQCADLEYYRRDEFYP